VAVFPCDWANHRYPGPQRSAYVVSAFGTDIETSKLRLCSRHYTEFANTASAVLAHVDEDSQPDSTCAKCGKDKQFAIYVKLFDLKQEPDYFATDVCASCWQTLRTQLKVANGHVMSSMVSQTP